MINNKLPFFTLFILIILGIILIIDKAPKSISSNIGKDFSLIDQNNQNVSLKDLKEKKTILFFGFTNCPDICPNVLNKVTIAINNLPQEKQDKFNLVFITTDPKRDTVAALNSYIKNFHPNYIALTGNEKEIKQVLHDYKIYSHQDKHTKMINHTALIYILDKKGKFHSHFSADVDQQELSKKLTTLL